MKQTKEQLAYQSPQMDTVLLAVEQCMTNGSTDSTLPNMAINDLLDEGV